MAPEGGQRLFVLSRDQGLIDTLEVVSFPNEVHAVDREADLAAALRSADAAVVLLDTAVVSRGIERLTQELKAQFPQIVLIVAGGPRDQTALAAQITQGTVYRFLAKPVSPQRIKLFLDAAWRRRLEMQPSGDPPARGSMAPTAELITPPRRPGTPIHTLLIAAIAIIAVGMGWLALRNLGPSPARTAPPPTSAATLDDLIHRGDAALARDDLVNPPEDNAAILYYQARRLSPSDPRVVHGVARVLRKLIGEAQTQLARGHIDAAQELTRQAWTLDPSNTQVATLLTQLAAVRVPGSAAAPPQPARRMAGRPVASPRSGQVEEDLRRAQERMRQDSLIEPPDDSARDYILKAQALAPSSPAVRQAGRQLLARVTDEARNALASGHLDDAERWIAAAGELGARPDDVSTLTQELERDRTAAKASATARTAALFDERLTQGKLLDPANDCAKLYLAELVRSAPRQPATLLAQQAFQARLLLQAQSAVRRRDYTSARRWLAAAREAGVDKAALAGVDGDIQSAQASARAAAAPSPPAQVTLKLTHYVEPVYPDLFRARFVKATVDLQFTVKPNGETTDVRVVASSAPGIFDEAAIDAVSHWRYQPVIRDGHPVSVRARIRVSFAP